MQWAAVVGPVVAAVVMKRGVFLGTPENKLDFNRKKFEGFLIAFQTKALALVVWSKAEPLM